MVKPLVLFYPIFYAGARKYKAYIKKWAQPQSARSLETKGFGAYRCFPYCELIHTSLNQM